MNKLVNFSFKFVYLNEKESERLMDNAFSKIFQKAYMNLINEKPKRFIIKAKENNGK